MILAMLHVFAEPAFTPVLHAVAAANKHFQPT
jgi:hypothetical protein